MRAPQQHTAVIMTEHRVQTITGGGAVTENNLSRWLGLILLTTMLLSVKGRGPVGADMMVCTMQACLTEIYMESVWLPFMMLLTALRHQSTNPGACT